MGADSYQNVIAGLRETMRSVQGVVKVMDYEPLAIHDLPCIILIFDSFGRLNAGQITAMGYRVIVRLCVRKVNEEVAEHELIPFVNRIPAAIDADPTLGGRITRGFASVSQDTRSIGVVVKYGDVWYRGVDVYVDITDKDAFQSGI